MRSRNDLLTSHCCWMLVRLMLLTGYNAITLAKPVANVWPIGPLVTFVCGNCGQKFDASRKHILVLFEYPYTRRAARDTFEALTFPVYLGIQTELEY